MSAKKSYNRFFIIFQEEDKGYGVGPDRPPTGYAKVETKNDKGKVTVYVQNLKPFENAERLYKCYLISHQADKDYVAYLGIMDIDELGRGESSWETTAEKAFDLQVSMDKFNGAAVIVEGEGIDGVVAPLAGYMSKEKFEWRSMIPAGKKKSDEPAEDEDKTEASAQEAPGVENKFDQYEKEIAELIASKEDSHDTEEEYDLQDARPIHEEDEDEMGEKEETEEGDEQETEKLYEGEREDLEIPEEDLEYSVENVQYEEYIRGKHKQLKNEKEKKYDYWQYDYHGHTGFCKDNPREMMKVMLEDILKDCQKMDETESLKDCKVWKIDMKKYTKDMNKIFKYPLYDLIFFPMMYNPYCNYYDYIKKHGHYFVGIKCDKGKKELKQVLFGIPGKKTSMDQPFQGMTGFVRWVQFNKEKDGCWIMMYDPMTGIISMSGE